MADHTSAVVDNPATGLHGDGASGSPATDKGEKYALDFVDRESTEKGFRELQGSHTRLAQENAQFRRDAEQANAIKAIADSQAALAKRFANDEISAEEYEAQIEQKAESLECSPKLLNYFGGIVTTAQRETAKQHAAELKALQDRFDSLDAGFREQKVTSSTIYQSNKELIDGIVAKGELSREQVIAVIADMPEHATAEGTSLPPGTMGGTGAVGGGQAKKAGLTPEQNERYRRLAGGNVTQAQMDATSPEELAAALQQRRSA